MLPLDFAIPVLRRLLILCPLATLLVGCARGGGSDGLAPLPMGRVAAPEPVVCAPSEEWTPTDEGGWEFRGLAEVGCWLDDPGPGALALRLEPRAATRNNAFRFAWNGTPLGGEPVRAGDTLRVEIPPERLGPGRHRLTVERYRVPGDGREPANRFDSMVLEVGAAPEERTLDPGAADRLRRLADFLLHGSTGSGGLHTAGWLLLGPRSLEVEIPAGAPRRLRARPENFSDFPATFRVELGDEVRTVLLEPGVRGHLEIPVPSGASRVRVGVEGSVRGLFLFGAPRLTAADAEQPGDATRPGSAPPVVLITLDTTRRDALGAYGAPDPSTPHLDRFAAGATVYENAVSTTSWTLPSHLSMFTGLYPSRHGLGVHRQALPDDRPTLAGLLRRRGYAPVGVAGGALMAHHLGGARDFLVYRDPLDGRHTPGDRLTDFALEALDETQGGIPFLFVNYFDPHHPYRAPAKFQEEAGVPAARAALATPVWRRTASGSSKAWGRLVNGEAELTEAGLAWLRAAYRAEVAFMDHELGRLFAELERRGLWDDALVAVVADHGELLGEGGYFTHGSRLDPELVEVPLIVKEPGQRRGRRVPGMVSVTDLFPTLLAAAGVDAPPSDGRRLDPGSRRPAGDRRRVLFEEHAARVHPIAREHLRIASHLWGFQAVDRRAVVWEGGAECRRRTADGPWRSEPCPRGGTRLLETLRDLLGESPAGAEGEAGELSEEQRSNLEALGYL